MLKTLLNFEFSDGGLKMLSVSEASFRLQIENTTNLMASPLEQFETTNLFSFTAPVLGDFVISLTNVGFYSLLVLIFVVGYHALSANNHRIVPSK